MNKKFTPYILVLFFAVLTFSSCIKDDSIGEINPVSKIEIVGELKPVYSLERWQTLKINAPEFKQTNTEKPLSYSWEIDYKEVSKEKNLTYVCEKSGKFLGRLKVSNEDGFFYKTFEVDVRYSYGNGLYILASHDGKTILSYYPEEIEGKSFELDVYEKNNPFIKLGTQPKTLFFTNTKSEKQVYIATGNPSALYRIDPDLMIAKNKIDAEEYITFVNHDGVGSVITDIKFIMNKRVADLKSTATLITNLRQQNFQMYFGDIEFSDKFYYWYTPDGRYSNGELYFDNLNSRMLIYSGGKPRGEEFSEIFPNTFKDKKAIDFCYAGKKNELAGIFRDKTKDTFYLCWFTPGYYNQWSPKTEIKPEIKYNAIMPNSSGITESAIITSSPAKNILYYSSKNNVYAYSILSKGNYPSAPNFVCGNADESIASMLVSKDESKLYVGTNVKTGNLKGSLYCFDINNNTLLWKKEKVTGEIVQLDYRYN